MKVIEKKFQHITVGYYFMTEEYKKQLEDKGYELVKINIDTDEKITGYVFELKEDVNESE